MRALTVKFAWIKTTRKVLRYLPVLENILQLFRRRTLPLTKNPCSFHSVSFNRAQINRRSAVA